MNKLKSILNNLFLIPFFFFNLFLGIYYVIKTRKEKNDINEKINAYFEYATNFFPYGEHISAITWIIILIKLTFF